MEFGRHYRFTRKNCAELVVLANPAEMEQCSGVKHADDTHGAFFIADLLRLGILPTGFIYDATLRPVRDLRRRRLTPVHHRTALLLSFKRLYTHAIGQDVTLSRLTPPFYNAVDLRRRKVLQVIRPCRESKTGWTLAPWQPGLTKPNL